MGYVYLIYDSEKCAYKIGVTRFKKIETIASWKFNRTNPNLYA